MPPPLPLLFLIRRGGSRFIRPPHSGRHRLLLCRPFSTPSSHHLELDISHPTYMVWGSNTGVGKTLVSAGLAFSVLSRASSSNPTGFLYLKPVQTGFPRDSDSRFVYRKVSDLFLRFRSASSVGLFASNHVLRASAPAARGVAGAELEEREEVGEIGLRELCSYEERRVNGVDCDEEEMKLVCKTMYGWKEAISPHLAAEREKAAVEDSVVLGLLKRCLGSGLGGGNYQRMEDAWRVIETAGGVASPGPSGTLQCDLYRPFRLPSILVGDGRLGGISGTVSSYETLKLRGYDVVAIILEDHGLSNEVPLQSYLENGVHVLVMPPVPRDPSSNLLEWFCQSSKLFSSLQDLLLKSHVEKIQRLHDIAAKAGNILWWPFTQHRLVPKDIITVIDSRCGENFAIHKVHEGKELIIPQFDACASWWTQGPDATMQIELARDMGYTAARFGHVMFPENVYEPALHCAELLLEGVGKGWASRTFFSDNGSTAIEIALKMAFRKFFFDHGIDPCSVNADVGKRNIDFRVLALNGSYHGDTLGAMEAQAPSSYTSFLQQPWYSGRGLFLDPPTIFICHGNWNLVLSKALLFCLGKPENMCFASRDDLFCGSRDSSELAKSYSAYISKQLSQFAKMSGSPHVGALIIEPVIQGAGGMHMIDPLFQRILVKQCRSRKIPIIFDEVFTGFWRLGRESAAELLGCSPDVACYAKLLTGGIIPLGVTLATEDVFNAFTGDSKIMALLHGHSYSAHPMGCTAASKAIQWFKDPRTNPNITVEGKKLKELWDMELVHQISSHSAVQRVIALGTLCAMELRADKSDTGYASLYANSLVRKLREDGVYMRPLGNVIYLMCGPCTSTQVCKEQLNKVYKAIGEFSQAQVRELQSSEA